MKKILVAAILGLAAINSVKAQGSVVLYNYNTGKLINYGTGSGGTFGQPVTGGFNVGFYFVSGNSAATVNTAFVGDATANGSLATLAPTLALFSGPNATATIGTDVAGYFSNQTGSANLGNRFIYSVLTYS